MGLSPILHHTEISAPGVQPDRWVLLLHGIYGAGRNWSSVGRRLVGARPELGVLAIDLRGHGDSPRLEPPHTVAACAADVEAVVQRGSYPVFAVLGHSFGGKVALLYSHLADKAPRQIWVIDSTPEARPPSGSAWDMLQVIKAQPGPFEDRQAAVSAVESGGFSTPVAQWMATNVVRSELGMAWRLDPNQMEDLLASFFNTDAWSLVESPRSGTHLHFVKATESAVMDTATADRIRRATDQNHAVSLHEVVGGHWLNADNPEALQELLLRHV